MSKSAFLFEQERRKRKQDTSKRDAETADALLGELFPAQRDFVTDRSRRKVALCPRRAGKSYCVLVYALIVALRRARAKVLVLARVRRQVKGVYWDVVQQMCEDFEIQAHFVSTELHVRLKNGSTILFAGADTAEEIDKYRGQGWDLVIIDECKSYSEGLLDELIEEIIAPALADRDGTLCLIGTPGAIPAGFFWALTTKQAAYSKPGTDKVTKLRVRAWADRDTVKNFRWSLHSWSSRDNHKMPWIWENQLLEKEENEWADDNPVWLREYLGQWVADSDALVYALHKVLDGRADWLREGGPHGLPEGHEWRYLLGVDLGWHDPTAFVVAAWSPTHPVLHYIWAEKHSELTFADIVTYVRELEARFGGFDARVVDSGGSSSKTLLESFKRDCGIPFEPARKTEKADHIGLFNSDLIAGKIKLDPFSPLADEMRIAQWGNAERTVVDRGYADHCADAALYIWRHAYHHWWKEPTKEIDKNSKEWWDEWTRQERRKVAAERRKAMGQDLLQKYNRQANQLPRSLTKLVGSLPFSSS